MIITMKNIVLCALTACTLCAFSCSHDQNAQASGEANEPVLSLTEAQKQSGAGYWSMVVRGPVVNESLRFACSEGSRAVYTEEMNLTRILARDAENAKTVLMIDFNQKRRGEYMLDPKTTDTVVIVAGVANADGSLRFTGTVDKKAEGALQITHYVEGGYIEGMFGGTMNINKEPHSVQGRFKVRMRQ